MPRVVCKTEQLTCLDVSSSAEGRWGKVYLLWVAKQLVYLKHRYLTEVVLWLYVMVTLWFQATQGASFAHGWRNFDPPRFAPHPISPPSPKRRGSHPFVSPNSHEEDHIHSCCTSLTLPSEDGESRQKPRPVVEKDDPSVLHMSACLILIFRLRTCQWCRFECSCMFFTSRWIDDGVSVICFACVRLRRYGGRRGGFVWQVWLLVSLLNKGGLRWGTKKDTGYCKLNLYLTLDFRFCL